MRKGNPSVKSGNEGRQALISSLARALCSMADRWTMTCQCLSFDVIHMVLAGDFAEAVRDQWLKERLEYFTDLENLLLEQMQNVPECSRDQLSAAQMRLDAALDQKQARPHASSLPYSRSTYNSSIYACKPGIAVRYKCTSGAGKCQGGQCSVASL